MNKVIMSTILGICIAGSLSNGFITNASASCVQKIGSEDLPISLTSLAETAAKTKSVLLVIHPDHGSGYLVRRPKGKLEFGQNGGVIGIKVASTKDIALELKLSEPIQSFLTETKLRFKSKTYTAEGIFENGDILAYEPSKGRVRIPKEQAIEGVLALAPKSLHVDDIVLFDLDSISQREGKILSVNNLVAEVKYWKEIGEDGMYAPRRPGYEQVLVPISRIQKLP